MNLTLDEECAYALEVLKDLAATEKQISRRARFAMIFLVVEKARKRVRFLESNLPNP